MFLPCEGQLTTAVSSTRRSHSSSSSLSAPSRRLFIGASVAFRSRGAMLNPFFPRSMIEIYKPDSLIVGTRGRPDSLFKSAFMGSISRYAQALALAFED